MTFNWHVHQVMCIRLTTENSTVTRGSISACHYGWQR